jgi:hypothetical protein
MEEPQKGPIMGNEAGVDRRASDILSEHRQQLQRFYAWGQLGGTEFTASAQRIAEGIFDELMTLPGASIRIQMSIIADLPMGVTEAVVRKVTENAGSAGLFGVEFTVFQCRRPVWSP